MKKIYRDPEDKSSVLEIPDHYDAEKLQELFSNLKRPKDFAQKMCNMIVIAKYFNASEDEITLITNLSAAYLDADKLANISVQDSILRALDDLERGLMIVVRREIGSKLVDVIFKFLNMLEPFPEGSPKFSSMEMP